MFNSVITLRVGSLILLIILSALIGTAGGFLLKPTESKECEQFPIMTPSHKFKPIPNNNGRRF